MKITEIISEAIPTLPSLDIDPSKVASAMGTMNKVNGFLKQFGIASDNTPFNGQDTPIEKNKDKKTDTQSQTKDDPSKPYIGYKTGKRTKPVNAPVTQPYAKVSSRGKHPGVDLGSKMGTPVAAPIDGQVTFAGLKGNCGNMLIIQGGNEMHKFCHLLTIKVSVGDKVSAGDTVAMSGGGQAGPGKGLSTGPHLHWEKYVAGTQVDPMANIG
jgi:murein DD-endopeptidase MepM/ murein hydrolase activator NlpD